SGGVSQQESGLTSQPVFSAAALTRPKPLHDDAHVEALIARMTAAQKQVFATNRPRPAEARPRATKVLPSSSIKPAQPRHKHPRELYKIVPDTARLRELQQLDRALCMAFANEVPDRPGSCRK